MNVAGRIARAFTIIELLIVLGLIVLLIALLLPSLSRARDGARGVRCASNQRQIAQGLFGYASEFRGALPYGFIDFGWGDPGDPTPEGQPTEQEWTHVVSGYLNAARVNGYDLPWNAQAIHYTDPDNNYHPVLYCTIPGSEFDRQQSHYNTNMTIFPHVYWDTWAGRMIQRGTHPPTTLAQMYTDNAMLWDGVQVIFAEGPTYRDTGFMLWPSPALTGVDGGNLAWGIVNSGPEGAPDGQPDLDLLYRGAQGDARSNRGDPDRSVEFPAWINPPDFHVGFPDLGDAWRANQDLIVPGPFFWVEMVGAPIFRHNNRERCNTTFADGSVRPLIWNPGNRHASGFWVTSEFNRNMLRPKYPSPPPRFRE